MSLTRLLQNVSTSSRNSTGDKYDFGEGAGDEYSWIDAMVVKILLSGDQDLARELLEELQSLDGDERNCGIYKAHAALIAVVLDPNQPVPDREIVQLILSDYLDSDGEELLGRFIGAAIRDLAQDELDWVGGLLTAVFELLNGIDDTETTNFLDTCEAVATMAGTYELPAYKPDSAELKALRALEAILSRSGGAKSSQVDMRALNGSDQGVLDELEGMFLILVKPDPAGTASAKVTIGPLGWALLYKLQMQVAAA